MDEIAKIIELLILGIYFDFFKNWFILFWIFSFVIFDNKSKEVISCRDRFGVKPLYYFEDSEKLIFSTERLLRVYSSLI